MSPDLCGCEYNGPLPPVTERLVSLGMFVSGARAGFHWLEVPGEAHLVGPLDQEGNLEAGLDWIVFSGERKRKEIAS